jgi:hypothetical protein
MMIAMVLPIILLARRYIVARGGGA